MNRYSMLGAISLGALAALGCQTTAASTAIKTSGMSADMSVTATGDGHTHALAKLKVGDISSSTNVDLQGGESLVASTGTTSTPMGKIIILGFESYNADFNGGDAESTAYNIALNRVGDTSAPNSTCALPAGFDLSTSAAGQTVSRASADLTVTWSNQKTDKMHFKLAGQCIKDFEQDISGDTGTITFAKGTILPFDQTTTSQTCDLTITIDRIRAGSLDPVYGRGGQINCIQERTIVVKSAP